MRSWKILSVLSVILAMGVMSMQATESEFVKSFRNPPKELYPIPWWS